MTLRNRVQPDGQIIAHPARGTLTGNRGILVDREGRMTNRQWAAKTWICCLLEFRGWRKPLTKPGTWTPLFFLDEAVALTAGHRPCAFCRRDDYNRFKDLWGGAKALEIDAILHTERLEARRKRLHDVRLEHLPDGAFILNEGIPMLVHLDRLLPYQFNGYGKPIPRITGAAKSLTPPSILHVLTAGYRPTLHLTAAPPPPGA